MKHRLAFRLAATYGLILILTVAVIDAAVILIYRDNQLEKNEKFYFGIAAMLSSMVENNVKITNYISGFNGSGAETDGRVVLLDAGGKVLLDSKGGLSGTSLTNPEFRETMGTGKPASGYYSLGGKGMAVFSYPVKASGRVNAAVVISVFIQDIYDDILGFSIQIAAISALAVLLVALASIWAGRRLSRPIVKLTAAAEQMGRGRTDIRVEVDRKDEIGVLAGAFNRMWGELQKIESGRRRFISDVSHELKTPLASIKVLVEALLSSEGGTDGEGSQGGKSGEGGEGGQRTQGSRDPEEMERVEYLQDIDHEIDRLTGLVRSLLTSARLEEVGISREELHLADEVDGVIRALAPLALQKRIRMENACDPSVLINADRSMLREVLINLADNAIKYGREGGCVRFECTAESFSVADDGQGIPEQELANIFDSFYRVDRSRSSEGGSGIGLFIVKRIITLHGFDIRVSSKPGSGSVFTVFFRKV